ncbi:hypothetical protein WMZ97_16755 [Lentibacillus sp. N15]|uniref:hypothetical protein n=1 Tax=Lentibacillus songyuanensis TaxID=3136161 RepID=UPI0031BA15EF
MEIETASDWLKNKGLSNADIDFVETILTFTSTAKEKNNKLDEINITLHMSFPDKKAKIHPNITLSQLKKILQDNGIDVDVTEMLSRYREQGLCSDLCNQILEGQLYH